VVHVRSHSRQRHFRLGGGQPLRPLQGTFEQGLVWQREHWNDIDPTVWIDDDGQAYMYWGNPDLYMIKLNKDMISTQGSIVTYPKIKDYQEGPWVYKHGNKYYMTFASTCCAEGIGYAMSDKITGPWTYKGDIMPHSSRSNGNHPGIIDFKGNPTFLASITNFGVTSPRRWARNTNTRSVVLSAFPK
jgi:Beta-xylosidase